MKTVYFILGATILMWSINVTILAKPTGADKTSNEDKLQCVDSNERSDQTNNLNSFSDMYKPHSKFEGTPERYSYKTFDSDRKRSLSDFSDDIAGSLLQKRQVGVVYKDEKPIGILQPYQRSYRFIPVKEENSYSSELGEEISNIDKRDTNKVNLDLAHLEESYPSILTNFKIDNKLDKKRNYDALTDENVRDLKATIRRLRSSNPRNSEQIEEELKNILDDMGLIDDEESHAEKREISDNQKDDEEDLETEAKYEQDRTKRDEAGNKFEVPNGRNDDLRVVADGDLIDKRENSEESSNVHREKRQKESKNSELVEDLKNSGDLTLSGNKSPLASKSEIMARDVSSKESKDEDVDYDKRVERQIQNKINLLKEEVKREIEALKSKKEEDDSQRKKRQVSENLADEETDALNPAINYEGDMKSLIRKRRTVQQPVLKELSLKSNTSRRKRDTSAFTLRKRRSEHSHDTNQQNYKGKQEDSDEGGELLGDDLSEGAIVKRQIFDNDHDYSVLNDAFYPKRNKRFRYIYENYPYNKHYFYEDGEKLNAQNIGERNDFQENTFLPLRPFRIKPRRRRRISKDQVMVNRPQQLSDMSDLDLFGALPKSYDGELSRYKRVRRN